MYKVTKLQSGWCSPSECYVIYSWKLEESAHVFVTSLVYAVLNWRVLDLAFAGASLLWRLKIKDRTLILKLYVEKTFQKITVFWVKFVVIKQWNVVYFPVGQHFFVKDVSPETMIQNQEGQKHQQMKEVWNFWRTFLQKFVERRARNITSHRDFTNINIPYFDIRFAEKRNLSLLGPSPFDCWTETEMPGNCNITETKN